MCGEAAAWRGERDISSYTWAYKRFTGSSPFEIRHTFHCDLHLTFIIMLNSFENLIVCLCTRFCIKNIRDYTFANS